MLKHLYNSTIVLVCTVFLLSACGGSEEKPATPTAPTETGLQIRLEAPVPTLCPLLPSSGYSRYVAMQVFQTLGIQDPETFELKPYLAKSIPTTYRIVTEGPYKGCLAYDFEINELAAWDNGSPILAEDVVFTLKLIFHPLLETKVWRGYFELTKGVEIDPANPRKFSIYQSKYYMLSLESLCGIPIYPAYHYDPAGKMKNIAIADLLVPKKADELGKTNQDLKDYATTFNDEKYSKNKDFIVGSTAYKVVFLDAAQGVTLERKKDWWGDKAVAGNPMLRAYPERIVYKYAKTEDAAINLIQANGLDIATGLSPTKFLELQADPKITANYEFKTHWAAQYNRILINTKDPILADRNVRQALAKSVDYSYLLTEVQKGMAQRAAAPVHPTQSFFFKELLPYEFDVEAAKAQLALAGWKDTDNDGIADKVIKGKKTPLTLEVMTTTGTITSDQVSSNLQSSAAKAGFKLVMKALELPVITKETQAGKYQLAITGNSLHPTWLELNQQYHSRSLIPNGDNRTGIANKELDVLIDQIRYMEDVPQRIELYKKAQQILYDEVAEVFLYIPQTRYVIRKNTQCTMTAVRPGYFEQFCQKR